MPHAGTNRGCKVYRRQVAGHCVLNENKGRPDRCRRRCPACPISRQDLRRKLIPLLAEEGWRDSLLEAGARGWREARARQGEASIEDRRNVSAGLTTPSAPSAHPPLLCEEGNTLTPKEAYGIHHFHVSEPF